MTMTDRLAGINEGVAVKAPCKVATTANIALTGLLTIDGVTVASGDRVLVKDQDSAIDNGIWVASSGAWSRALDFNGTRDVVEGTLVYVISGTVNVGTFFKLTTTSPVVGSSSLAFTATLFDTDNVSYLASGTGAVSRTMTSKAGDSVSILDYGAVASGDATTNANAINAAITAVNAAGGGIVNVPAGTFDIDMTIGIIMKSNVTLQGAGQTATTIRWSGMIGMTQDLIGGASALTKVKIRNMNLNMRNARGGSGTGTGSNGALTITLTGVTGSIVAGQLVTGTNVGKNATVSSYDSGTGVVTVNVVNAGAVSGTIYFDGAWSCVGLQLPVDLEISDCNFAGFTRFGIGINGGTRCKIRRNYIIRTATAAYSNQSILVSSSAGIAQGFVIAENDMVNSGLNGSLANSFITRNYINGFAFGAGITTEQDANCFSLVISENQITGGTGTDDNLYTCGGIENWAKWSTISNNLVFSNGGAGIDHGGQRSVVSGNIVFNNGASVNSPGITARYGDATYNSIESVYIGNRCFDTGGGAGTQTYGYTDQNASVTYQTLIGNSFKNNKTGSTSFAGTVGSFVGHTLHGSTSYNPGLIGAGDVTAEQTLTVSGAALGDVVSMAFSQALAGCEIYGEVKSSNTVAFRIANPTAGGITPASGTAYATVIKTASSADF